MRLILFLIIVQTSDVVVSQDLETRFAYHNFAKADVNDGFSVLIERASLHESKRPLEPGEAEQDPNEPKGFVRQVGTVRMLKRLVVAQKGKWQRVDGIEYPLMAHDGNLKKTTHNAELVHELEGWFYENHQLQSNLAPRLERFRIAGGVAPRFSSITRRHPFDIAWAQAAGVNWIGRPGTVTYDHQVIDEKQLPDGRTQFLTFVPEGPVFRITFSKEESWCNEEVEFWIDDAQFDQVPRKKVALVTEEMIARTYKRYAVNRTRWKKIGDHFVPVLTFVSSQTRFHNDDFEIRFADWKFGKDVDESLLDEANFTVDAIPKSIDFNAIRDLFDNLRNDEEVTKR
jgi:hypothetical protein